MMKNDKTNAIKATVGATVVASVLAFAGAASAQDADPDYGGNGASPAQEPEVQAVPLTPTADSGDSTGAVATPAVQSTQQLPVTGGDAATIALLGSVLVAGGGVLVWRSKGAGAEA